MLSILSTLLPVILPVLVCAGVGVLWTATRQPFNQEFIRRLVMWICAPALIISTLGGVDMPLGQLQTVVMATLVLLLMSTLLGVLVCLLLRLPVRDFIVALVFGNHGNMGLPLCLFAFGQEGLVFALGMFVVISVVHFSLGAALLNRGGVVKGVVRTPIIHAGLIAFAMIVLDWRLPLALTNTLDILGSPTVPLMLITLGVSLGSLRAAAAGRALVLACARLLVGLGAGLATVALLDLEGLLASVVLVQAATPSAVFNYLLAMQYGRQAETVAGVVVWSTVLSFFSIPALIYFMGLI